MGVRTRRARARSEGRRRAALAAAPHAGWGETRLAPYRHAKKKASPALPSSPQGRIRRRRRRQSGAPGPPRNHPGRRAQKKEPLGSHLHPAHVADFRHSLLSRPPPRGASAAKSGGSPASPLRSPPFPLLQRPRPPSAIHAVPTVTPTLIQPAVFGGEVGWRGVRGEAGGGGGPFLAAIGAPPPPPRLPPALRLPRHRTLIASNWGVG
jgi:hypothetical protein